MFAILDFECRPSVAGYRVAKFDMKKFRFSFSDFDEDHRFVGVAPSNASDDEKEILQRAGESVLYWPFEPRSSRPIIDFLLPNSGKTRSFNLFRKDPEAYLTLAGTPQTIEGVITFANKFGPLRDFEYEFV